MLEPNLIFSIRNHNIFNLFNNGKQKTVKLTVSVDLDEMQHNTVSHRGLLGTKIEKHI